MKSWIPAVALAVLLSPVALPAAEPPVHVMFKPVRTVRIGELVQIELDVEVTNFTPDSASVQLTFVGSESLEARYARPFGGANIAKDQSVHLRQLVTVPEVEVMRWERQEALPRFRIEYFAVTGHGVVVIEAVPAGPPDDSRARHERGGRRMP